MFLNGKSGFLKKKYDPIGGGRAHRPPPSNPPLEGVHPTKFGERNRRLRVVATKTSLMAENTAKKNSRHCICLFADKFQRKKSNATQRPGLRSAELCRQT